MKYLSFCSAAAVILTTLLGFGGTLSISEQLLKNVPGISTKPIPIHQALHPVDTNDRIVGGLEAKLGQFPYQASIQAKFAATSSHYCGGSFISPNYVVTAAHCMRGRRESDILVMGGSIDFEDAVVSEVSKIIIHPGYNQKTVINDIALLKLASPVKFSANIDSIIAPIPFEETPEFTKCFVSGWGTTQEGGTSLPDTLRFVDVNVQSDQKCREQYGEDEIVDSMLCAGFEDGEKDSCQGDSGGPLSCNGQLTGIVSWGYGCAREYYPGVYTQVSYFVDWIKEQTCGTSEE